MRRDPKNTRLTGLTADYVREILNYDPETGVFRWAKQIARCAVIGKITGRPCSSGGLQIMIGYKQYMSHRLAWLYMTGKWPLDEIDHINGDPSDNRFCNLREATGGQNKLNKGKYKNNKSGYKGVHFHKQSGKWRARIWFGRKSVSLGLFDTPEEASLAYIAASADYHGEFARVV